MKIQDIFNLPKNRGGAKLFNRIMNRYGIPKEDSKELKNNIDNSSSGGGGGDGGNSDVEYWKISEGLTRDDKVIIYALGSMFKMIDVNDNIGIAGGIIPLQENSSGSPIKTLLAFMFNKTIMTTLIGQYTINSFVDYLEILASEGEDRMYILEHLTPITKEEFYNLN